MVNTNNNNCQRFIQNAWKRDLCSNCFKSKDEHVLTDDQKNIRERLNIILNSTPPPGILKINGEKRNVSVSFKIDENEIIGYDGGDDEIDEDERVLFFQMDDIEKPIEPTKEEEKELEKLTEINTNFNSNSENLLNNCAAKIGENRKQQINLKLGKPLLGADGKKQTLLVTVEPFNKQINNKKIEDNNKIKENEKIKENDKTNEKIIENIKEDLENDKNVHNIEKQIKSQEIVNKNENEDNKENKDYNKGDKEKEKNMIKIVKEEKIENEFMVKEENAKNKDNKSDLIENEILKENSYDFPNFKSLDFIRPSSSMLSLPLVSSSIEIEIPGSRDMAGAPDGKADSDSQSDPPSLVNNSPGSSSPSSSESHLTYVNPPQRSFLHGFVKAKPKLAAKPSPIALSCRKLSSSSIMDLHKMNQHSTPPSQLNTPTKFCPDSIRSTKRQAPQPPRVLFDQSSISSDTTTPEEESPTLLKYARRRSDGISFDHISSKAYTMDTPKSTFENSTITPNFQNNGAVSCYRTETDCNQGFSSPSKSLLSLSYDSIMHSDKIKKQNGGGTATKVKSTIRKFLRFNSKEEDKSENDMQVMPPVTPKRKIEIIHPLDLNTSAVEVVYKKSDYQDVQLKKDREEMNDGRTARSPTATTPNHITGRPSKPPPPPRTQSLELRLNTDNIKKQADIIMKCSNTNDTWKPQNTPERANGQIAVYENIVLTGECRQNLVPAKPQRSSSMRNKCRPEDLEVHTSYSSPDEKGGISKCDNNNENHDTRSQHQHNNHNNDNNFERYTRRNSEKMIESNIFTYTLEDNYDAVISANHEALSQLLLQMNEECDISDSLRFIKSSNNLKWKDFDLLMEDKEDNNRRRLIDLTFYNTKYGGSGIPVVISITNRHRRSSIKSLPSSITMTSINEFTDSIPIKLFKSDSNTSNDSCQAYVTVWNEQQMESLESYGKRLHSNNTNNTNNNWKESGLMLLQVVNAAKILQAAGIEEIAIEEYIVCARQHNSMGKLCVIPSDIDLTYYTKRGMERQSLCKSISMATEMLFSVDHPLRSIIKEIVKDEHATSLSQCRATIEFWLWGPMNKIMVNDKQLSFQRWLDLERANILGKMICSKERLIELHYHLIFLVRTNAKTLLDASILLQC